jgi:hypothetical protein
MSPALWVLRFLGKRCTEVIALRALKLFRSGLRALRHSGQHGNMPDETPEPAARKRQAVDTLRLAE